jgi:hypothetical protein
MLTSYNMRKITKVKTQKTVSLLADVTGRYHKSRFHTPINISYCVRFEITLLTNSILNTLGKWKWKWIWIFNACKFNILRYIWPTGIVISTLAFGAAEFDPGHCCFFLNKISNMCFFLVWYRCIWFCSLY